MATTGDDIAPVDVVVVTYRSAGYIRSSVEAALEALADLPHARVIVVDNASGDGIEDVLGDLSPRAQLIRRTANDGFAAGCHAGAAASTARRLLFLNPDAVVEPTTVRTLLKCAGEYPKAGVIGGRAVGSDGRTDPRSWWGRPTLWSSLCFAVGASSIFPGSPIFDSESSQRWDGRDREVPVVSGALMLVEREAWDQLGGFDTNFFLYGEDADLCLRARATGWSPRVCGEATFRHRVGASSEGGNRLPMLMRGKATTYLKNPGGARGRLAVEMLVIGTGLRAGLAGLRGRGNRPRMSEGQWREAWRRREEWRHGW